MAVDIVTNGDKISCQWQHHNFKAKTFSPNLRHALLNFIIVMLRTSSTLLLSLFSLNKAEFTWSPDDNISKTGVLSGKDNLDFPLVKKLVISSTSCWRISARTWFKSISAAACKGPTKIMQKCFNPTCHNFVRHYMLVNLSQYISICKMLDGATVWPNIWHAHINLALQEFS